ncbi:MAG TPA: hypothetical protein VGR93_11615, partial [Candidatus Acidoferrales bacterium]|nr:hypothetical protein [Candidatus Acidoferrales bacterium]
RRALVRYLRQQNPDGSLSDTQLVDSFLHTCSEISQAAKTVSRSRRYDEVVDGALVMCKSLPESSSIKQKCYYIAESTAAAQPKAAARPEPDDDVARVAAEFLASLGRA